MLLLATAACSQSGQQPLFSQFEPVNPQGWHRVVMFEFMDDSIPARPTTVDASVVVRCTPDFPYRQLWLAVRRFQNEQLVATDTVSVPISGDNGEPYGQGTVPLVTYTAPFDSALSLSRGWRIEVTHAMKQEEVKGINNIGVVLHPRNNSTK